MVIEFKSNIDEQNNIVEITQKVFFIIKIMLKFIAT